MPFAAAAAAVGVAGAAYSAYSSSEAAGAQKSAINQGKAEANAALQPYATGGLTAFNASSDLTGINGADAATAAMGNFTASPGYQYSVDQGLKGVDHGAASIGLLHSGSTIKAEQTLGTNLANQDFGNYVSRLNTLAGYGASAAGAQAQVDTGAAGATSNIIGQENKNVNSAIQSGTSALEGGLGGGSTNGLSSYFGGNSPSSGGSTYLGTAY